MTDGDKDPMAIPVDVWCIDTISAGEEQVAAAEACLAEEDRARAVSLGRADRRRAFVLRRGLVRRELGRRLGCSPGHVPIVSGAHGKPCLAAGGPAFNGADSGRWALVAISDQPRVGIDVEQWRSVGMERLGRRFLPAEELGRLMGLPPDARRREFFRLWTRMEAFLKATGQGIGEGLAAHREAAPWCRDEPRDGLALFDIAINGMHGAALAAAPGSCVHLRWEPAPVLPV